MQTRAYSICRRCAAVFPDGRRCPVCDGDLEAARAVAVATAHAIEAAPARRVLRRARPVGVIAAAVLLGLVVALGVAAAAVTGGRSLVHNVTGHADAFDVAPALD